MIARDNEPTIGAALESAKPWVDEIIVVDTGSTDQTPNIAKQYGARVEHFEWCDDFAAARNESLKYATGQWIFWMDTDDTLPSDCGRKLQATLSRPIPEETLGLIMQVHCPGNQSGPNSPHKEGQQTDTSVTVVDHVKAFRNRDDLKFEGRIHEQILPAIRAAGGEIQWTDIHVVHSGSDGSPEGMQRKLDRDLRLLRMDAQDRPDHPFVKFNLGMTLVHMGEFVEAKSVLEACIETSMTGESHLRKAYVLLVDALENLGESDEALRRCWEGLGRLPEDLELAFKLGRLLMIRENWAEASTAFQRMLRADSARYFSSMDPNIKGYKSHANLAVCLAELGQFQDALNHWVKCLTEMPRFIDGWDRVLELVRKQEKYSVLRKLIKSIRDPAGTQEFLQVCEAHLMMSQDRVSEAIECYEAAMKSGNHEGFVMNEYARFLCENHQWQESLSILEKLKELESDNPSPSFNLGHSLMQLERYEEAIDAFEDSLKLRPGHEHTEKLLCQCRASIAVAS